MTDSAKITEKLRISGQLMKGSEAGDRLEFELSDPLWKDLEPAMVNVKILQKCAAKFIMFVEGKEKENPFLSRAPRMLLY